MEIVEIEFLQFHEAWVFTVESHDGRIRTIGNTLKGVCGFPQNRRRLGFFDHDRRMEVNNKHWVLEPLCPIKIDRLLYSARPDSH